MAERQVAGPGERDEHGRGQLGPIPQRVSRQRDGHDAGDALLVETAERLRQALVRARQIAELLGFDAQDQTRLSTATSELARNAFDLEETVAKRLLGQVLDHLERHHQVEGLLRPHDRQVTVADLAAPTTQLLLPGSRTAVSLPPAAARGLY